jgi:hypothetical protein
MEKKVKSKLKCSKCKSIDLVLVELWKDATIEWEQFNGEFYRNDGNLEPGYPYALEARCKTCGHCWKVRGVSQIDQIVLNP